MLVGRAIAGSVWSASKLHDSDGDMNEALAMVYSDLEESYRKAGREAELRYVAPDTSALMARVAPAAVRALEHEATTSEASANAMGATPSPP